MYNVLVLHTTRGEPNTTDCQVYTQSCRYHFNDFGDYVQLVDGLSSIYPKLQVSFQRLWSQRSSWRMDCQVYTQSCRDHFNDFGDCVQLGGWIVKYMPKVAGIISMTLVTAFNLADELSSICPKLPVSFQRLC